MHLRKMKYTVLHQEKINTQYHYFMIDKQCEELTFPNLFPKGRYGYTTERKLKLTPTKYFNVRLLHQYFP